MSASGSDRGPREGWADLAKGVCIVLVVLWHVVVKHSADLPWTDAGGIPALWVMLSAQLLPLRMPLFFLISGMFASGAVLTPTRGKLGPKVMRLASLYLIWVILQTFALAAAPGFDTARASNLGELLLQLTVSPTNLWYLLALTLYLLLGRVTRRVPTRYLLAAAFVVSAVAGAGMVPEWGNLWQIFQNVFFFVAGLRLRQSVRAFASASSAVRVIALAAAYGAAAMLTAVLGIRHWFGVWTLLSALAVALGLTACVLIDRHEVLAAPWRWVGRRTLPIYVIHMVPLALLDRLLRGVDSWVYSGPVLAVLEPLLVTAVVIAASLGLHVLLVRLGAGVLFDPLRVKTSGRRHRMVRGR